MGGRRNDILQGALALLALKTLACCGSRRGSLCPGGLLFADAQGRKQLAEERESWARLTEGVERVLHAWRGGETMAWNRRILNVFRRARVRRDIDRELSFHLAGRATDLSLCRPHAHGEARLLLLRHRGLDPCVEHVQRRGHLRAAGRRMPVLRRPERGHRKHGGGGSESS